MLNGNRIAEIEARLYKLENEEFYLEMADIQSEAEKTRLRGIRQEQRRIKQINNKLKRKGVKQKWRIHYQIWTTICLKQLKE